MRKTAILGILILAILTLVGCKKVRVFEEKVDTSGIPTYKKSELSSGKVYIKDGAVFMLPSEIKKENMTYFYNKGFNDIPTLYKGEILAYSDNTTANYSTLHLTRLKSIGYTFGIYNGSVNAKGEYEFRDSDILEIADSYTVFPHNDKNIRIVTLDGEAVKTSIVENGVLGANADFDANSEHEISCYIGTHYYEGTIKNDIFSLVNFEEYNLTDISETKNGYIQIAMDSDMKSGYYYLEGQGIFRYVAEEKKSVASLYDVDYYVALYSTSNRDETEITDTTSEGEPSSTVSPTERVQTYSVPISEKKYDYVFTVNYEVSDSTPFITLASPTGATYVLKEEKAGVQSVMLKEVIIGEWKITIGDTKTRVTNVTASEKEKVVATKEVVKDFVVTETKSSQKVTVKYEGQIFNAYVVDSNNEVTVITPKSTGLYEYTFDFLEAGTYKVYVVCAEDSTVEINIEDCSNYETEIIVVE